MNVNIKHRLVSCSTQTNSKKNIKNLKNSRVPSLKNIRLKLDNFPFYNNDNNYKITNNLKGKKVLKKKKLLDIYNILYNSKSILSPDKKEIKKEIPKLNNNKNKNKKGEIAISFEGADSSNKIIITEMNNNKKNNFRIYKKLQDNNSNNIIENKYPLLNKPIYKLPLYNVRKILTNNMEKNNLLYNNNELYNKYEDSKINSDSIKENFPIIQNNNNFDSTDIKKENAKILSDLFKRNCINKKKINKKILKTNYFSKKKLDENKLYNCITQENNKFFKNKDFFESNELNSIKNKARKLFIKKNNKTSENMVLSNDF